MDKKLLRLEGEVEIERRRQEHNDDDDPHFFIVEYVHEYILAQVAAPPIPLICQFYDPRTEKLLTAEARGFEPLIPFPVCCFSRAVPSTTRPRFLMIKLSVLLFYSSTFLRLPLLYRTLSASPLHGLLVYLSKSQYE